MNLNSHIDVFATSSLTFPFPNIILREFFGLFILVEVFADAVQSESQFWGILYCIYARTGWTLIVPGAKIYFIMRALSS